MFTFPERHRILLPVVAAGLLLLSACGSSSSAGGSAADTSVATLETPAAGPKATATPAAERPLIRADTSAAEQARMYRVYLKCLKAAGVPRSAVKGTWENGGVSVDTAAQYRPQCGSKEPQSELDKARESDPDFADHLRADTQCLNDHGIRAEIRKDGDIWLLDDLPPDSKAHWLDDCEQQAFSSYYGTLS